MYLQSSQVEVTNLYLGVPTKTPVALINGTLLPTQFHWGKVGEPTLSGPRPATLSPRGLCGGGRCPPDTAQNRLLPLELTLPPAPRAMADGATSLCIRASCPCSPSPWASQGGLFSPENP